MPTESDDNELDDNKLENNEPDKTSVARETCAQWLSAIALALFIMGPLMLLTVWLSAKQGGHLPDWENWGPNGTNHGPWHGSQNLGHLHYGFDKALAFPCYAFLCAGVSYFVKPNLRAVIILAASLLFNFTIMLIFMPLFD